MLIRFKFVLSLEFRLFILSLALSLSTYLLLPPLEFLLFMFDFSREAVVCLLNVCLLCINQVCFTSRFLSISTCILYTAHQQLQCF